MAGLVITGSTYAGESAGQYIGTALLSAASLDSVTVLENIISELSINR